MDARYLEEIKAILKKYLNQNQRVFLFGSRAAGTAHKYSDVDIAIEADQPLDPATKVKLEESFENSNVPFRVDIVDFSQVSEDFKAVAKQHLLPL